MTDALQKSFSTAEWPRFISCEPIVSEQGDDALALTMEIAPTVQWFKGHFPEQPVLPGVVQTHWAVELARALVVAPSQTLCAVVNLKFHKMILPGAVVTLVLQADPRGASVKFRYLEQGQLYSEGKLNFSEKSK